MTLALTAIFVEHLQMLAYPAALGAATLVLAAKGLWRPLGALVAAACVGFALWSALKHEDLSQLTIRTWTTAPLSTPGLALEETRARARSRTRPAWRTPCSAAIPRMGMRRSSTSRWTSAAATSTSTPSTEQEQLDETIACVRREDPRLVLVTTGFYDPIPGEPAWEAFVADARALLASRYDLVTEVGMSQVWRRR